MFHTCQIHKMPYKCGVLLKYVPFPSFNMKILHNQMSATRSTGQRRTWCRGRAQCSRSALSASVTLLVLGFGEQVICIRLQVRKMTRPTFIAQLCLLQWMAYFLGEDWAMTFLTAAVLLLLLMRLCMVGVLPTTEGVWRTGGLC